MDDFNYQNGKLFAENVAVDELANMFGTPLYIYSKALLTQYWQAFDNPLKGHPHLVCYAVKANSNIAILNLFAKMGSGFDIVSQGELERVLVAGGDPKKVVFSGVAKSETEIKRALEVGIRCFNVESLPELERINAIAGELGVKAPVSLRVNPDVDAKTHPYISTGLKENKFGISHHLAVEAYRFASQLEHLDVKGIDCHIGSQLTETAPFLDALDRIIDLIEQIAAEGITIKHLDLGGGLGVCYDDEVPPTPAEYIDAILAKLKNYPQLELLFEPGRVIVANAGILLSRVEYLKYQDDNNFAIVDAGMNDLIRPALYESWMRIITEKEHPEGDALSYDIVGPICETSDFLGKGRKLALKQGDLIAVCGAGAYGFTMSSNYNTRARPAEVMVDGDQIYLVREREQLSSLWRGERLIAD